VERERERREKHHSAFLRDKAFQVKCYLLIQGRPTPALDFDSQQEFGNG